MKCASCGLPLSPSRVNASCPRCGASANAGQKSTGTPNPAPYEPPSWGGNGGGVPLGIGMSPQNGQWGQEGLGRQAAPSSYNPSLAQAPVFQAGLPSQAAPANQVWLPSPTAQPGFSTRPNAPQGSPSPRMPQSPRNNRNARIGFIAAGLCVLAGGLLLLFVYFMALGPGNANNTGNANSLTRTASSPTSASVPTSAPSPTATPFPGQQFIDNAQMSSTAPSSSQPGQAMTTFKVNQKVYVTFNLHTGGQSGAVCILWYLNSKQAFAFQFPVSANSKSSYAYIQYGNAGSAYVELYWASNTSCANQVLAQHVDFTITQ